MANFTYRSTEILFKNKILKYSKYFYHLFINVFNFINGTCIKISFKRYLNNKYMSFYKKAQ